MPVSVIGFSSAWAGLAAALIGLVLLHDFPCAGHCANRGDPRADCSFLPFGPGDAAVESGLIELVGLRRSIGLRIARAHPRLTDCDKSLKCVQTGEANSRCDDNASAILSAGTDSQVESGTRLSEFESNYFLKTASMPA